MTERFTCSMHKTIDRAEAALEDYYATGEVYPCEQPRIERKKNGETTVYIITIAV